MGDVFPWWWRCVLNLIKILCVSTVEIREYDGEITIQYCLFSKILNEIVEKWIQKISEMERINVMKDRRGVKKYVSITFFSID